MPSSKKLVPALGAVVLAGAASIGSVATAAPAQALTVQSCYGGAVSYTSHPGDVHTGSNSYWPDRGTYARTSGSCNDINIKTTATRDVKVCFRKTGTCNGWTLAAAGRWEVIASSVLSGTDFYLQFHGVGVSKGQLAY